MPETKEKCPTCGAASDCVRGGLCMACVFSEVIGPDAGEALPMLGGLELLEELARGGMGIVYRARQREPYREVALKALPGATASSVEARERFRVEAQVMARLDHPGILPIYAFGEEDGTPYFTMRLAAGGSLSSRKDEFAGNWRGIAELLAGVAGAVHFAHQRGVLHRDLKPGNILFDETGQAFVSDFGLAKLAGDEIGITRTAALMGTPHYMAPELADPGSSGATTASDVWALGAILYELLAGRKPFPGESIPVVLRQAAENAPPALPDKVPRELRIIVGRALQKDPALRYTSARALAEDLGRWLRHEPILARPVPLLGRLRLWTRRHPGMAALSALLVLAAGGAVASLVLARQQTLERLRVSLITQAQAARTSSQPGQRAAALEALRQAVNLGGPVGELRDDFISTLVMADHAELRRLPWDEGGPPVLSRDFRQIARVNAKAGTVTVETEDGPASALPALSAPAVAAGPFSNDGRLLAVHTETETYVRDLEGKEWLPLTAEGLALPRGTTPCFSPDGEWLARVLAPERPEGKSVVELIPMKPGVPPVRWGPPWPKLRLFGFSPDGKSLAAGGFGETEAVVAEAMTGVVQHTFRHPGRVRCGAWRQDGGMLAVGTENFKVYLWRMADDALPPQLLGHAGNVVAVAWSPDGSRLVSAAQDGTTRLWEAASARTLAEWPWTGEAVQCARDGGAIVTQDTVRRETVISQLGSSDLCRDLPVPHPDVDVKGTAGSWCTVFSPDGQTVLAGDTGGVYLYDAGTGRLIGHQPADYCWSIVFTSAEHYCGSTRQGVQFWSLSPEHPAPVTELPGAPVSADMLSAAGPGVLAVGAGNRVLFYQNGQPAGVFDAGMRVDQLALSPDGRYLACGLRDQPGILLHDRAKPGETPRVPLSGAENTVAWTAAGLLFAGDAEGLHFVPTERFRGKTLGAGVSRPVRSPDPVAVAVAARADLAAAVVTPGEVTLVQASTGRLLGRLSHPQPRQIKSIALSPDGTRLAAMTRGHLLRLWDLGKINQRLAEEGLPPP